MEELKKKYGLFTAVCMVVGIVIGSGIFFKSKEVFAVAEGNAIHSILAWVISGLIIVAIATSFGVLASKEEGGFGVIDYAQRACGNTYAYLCGWFLATVYYPAMTSVVAWVCARYTLVLAGYAEAPLGTFGGLNSAFNSPECIILAFIYLIFAYALNSLSPKTAGALQVSSTAVKLFCIFFVGALGLTLGLFNGQLTDNFTLASPLSVSKPQAESTGLFPAICSTLFAYEGWIVATAVNSEIKNSKRNLPIALCFGTFLVVLAYTAYNLGILGLGDINEIADKGTSHAFGYLGSALSTFINFMAVISCLGTLNGLMLGCSRGMYSLSHRYAENSIFSEIGNKTDTPHNSAIFALLVSVLWFAYYVIFGSGFFEWEIAQKYGFDSSELPVVTIYPMYLPIILSLTKDKNCGFLKRFFLPLISTLGIGIILWASITKHKTDNLWYLILWGIIMLIGFALFKAQTRRSNGAI